MAAKKSTKKAPKQDAKKAPVKEATSKLDADAPPKPGTVLTRTCGGKVYKCEALADGTFKVPGVGTFGSLSGAAKSVAEANGLNGSLNGKIWWGAKRAPSAVDPVEAFNRAAEAILVRAQRLVTSNDGKSIGAVRDLARHLDRLLKP